MLFAHDTEVALASAASLVNTRRGGRERLTDQAALEDWLEENPFTGSREHTDTELAAVRRVRERIRAVWEAPDRDAAAAATNELLQRTASTPRLTRHGDWDWHIHASMPSDPLAHRIGAEAAMGFVDLIRSDDLARLRTCAADDCDAVLVDLSRNRSRRYCDTGNCGNRAHVAAYRARRAAAGA
ncbi:MAG TPA: CGNR zinc finger domain-containing protein [Segeticoccus sp.]|uniref:CGNR zinc finger domain-containing protein n=1 Tax=Segeticoccus sp. TaxID=2706531 RepID=UPI002D7FD110|nr:CGNR zinc finger domain-containing protein [Segeticoccus sp.]HET8601501.1 CGNR zinc finger domain-containing protein [Segeticoccus sp.]